MRMIVYRTDANGFERSTEIRIPDEAFDEMRLVGTAGGEDVDFGVISEIDSTWEPRG